MTAGGLCPIPEPIVDETTSSAWLKALHLANDRGGRLLHLRVTITEPGSEEPHCRARADAILRGERKAPVNTIVNTLFPAALAQASGSHAELVRRYLAAYPWIKKCSSSNNRGTYFGRLVAYP